MKRTQKMKEKDHYHCRNNRNNNNSVITTIIVFLLSLSFVSSAFAQSDMPREIVSIEKDVALEKTLHELGYDLLFEWEGRIYILVNDRDLLTLNRLRIPYLFETHRFPAQSSSPQVSAASGINGDYHSYGELEAELQSLEQAFPLLASLSVIGTSLEQRNIYALKISDNAAQEEDGEVEVLFLGCHHAREWISVEVPLLLARFLLENYGTDARVRRLVDESEIWIVPLVNPDGLEYSIHFYRYWRKNRRFNSPGSYGVDLNRNYGYQWGYNNIGSSPDPNSEVYRGTAPFSEPETQAVRDLFLGHDFQALVSYHSFSQIIIYPWGYIVAPTDKDALLEEIAADMSALMLPVNGRFYGYGRASDSLYTTNGDTTDWSYAASAIPSYTIELPPIDQLYGGFFNAETDIQGIFRENLPAALYLIERSIATFSTGDSGLTPGARERERETGWPSPQRGKILQR